MSSTLFCIDKSAESNTTTKKLLQEACVKRNVEYVAISSESYDATNPPEVKNGDMIYRVSPSLLACEIERAIIQPDSRTLYKDNSLAFTSYKQFPFVKQNNLHIPETIYHNTRDKKLLAKYAEALGGFPIVVKVLGGSHGVGVMKIDSLGSLFSVVDVVVQNELECKFMEFIDVKSSARLIVLGDKVIDSIEYMAPEGDFRSNEGGDPNVIAKKFSPEVEDLAIRATALRGANFGGVDILIDANEHMYLAEVNFPCFFPRAQETTGTDIAGMMIDYLLAK